MSSRSGRNAIGGKECWPAAGVDEDHIAVTEASLICKPESTGQALAGVGPVEQPSAVRCRPTDCRIASFGRHGIIVADPPAVDFDIARIDADTWQLHQVQRLIGQVRHVGAAFVHSFGNADSDDVRHRPTRSAERCPPGKDPSVRATAGRGEHHCGRRDVLACALLEQLEWSTVAVPHR